MLTYAKQSGQSLEQEIDLAGYMPSKTLRREVFTSLSQRLATEDPGLLPAFGRLRDGMDAADFEKYMESLVRIRQSDEMLLVITKDAMHRTMIEGRFRDHLAKAFNAGIVQVLSQL